MAYITNDVISNWCQDFNARAILFKPGSLVRNIYELWQTCPHIDSIQNVIHTMTPYYCFINVIVISLRPHFIHNGCIVHIFTILQDPQAAVHSSPYFLQLHLIVLQPPTQLQWIIWSRTSGAGVLSIITGISLSPWRSKPHFVGSIFSLQPIHTMPWR